VTSSAPRLERLAYQAGVILGVMTDDEDAHSLAFLLANRAMQQAAVAGVASRS